MLTHVEYFGSTLGKKSAENVVKCLNRSINIIFISFSAMLEGKLSETEFACI